MTMSRHAPTRLLVRQHADAMVAEGQTPSSTAILKALGRGSASTVVDELRRWEAERKAAQEEAAAATARAIDPLYQAAALTCAVQEATKQIKQLQVAIEQGQAEARVKRPGSLESVFDLLSHLAKDVGAINTTLARNNERVDSTQRKSLLEIEDARTREMRAREEFRQYKDAAKVMIEAERQMANALREEINVLRSEVNYLRGRLGEPMSRFTDQAKPPAPPRMAPRTTPTITERSRYTGHPRVMSGSDEYE